MNPDAVNIELTDGRWVSVKPFLTRGDRRAIDKATRSGAFSAMGEIASVGIDVETLRSRAEEDPDLTDQRNDDEEDQWLARCVIGGSMWDSKPTVEQVEALPDDDTELILLRMRQLYKRTPEQIENLTSRLPSTPAETGP